MSLTQSQVAYYHEQADYNGVVATARLETEGLTAENYLEWHFRLCKLHYNSVLVFRRGSFYAKYPMGDSWPRVGHWTRFVNRRRSRLYVRLKLDPIRETALLFKQQGSMKYKLDGSEGIADKKLFLAQVLRRVATELCKDVIILRNARLGGMGVLNSLNSFKQDAYSAYETGKRAG